MRQFSFGFGHVRQLDRVTAAPLTRAWAAGGSPGDLPMFIDVDSTVVEVRGHDKQAAAYGYTRALGYHPILASRAVTCEVLHGRMRKGSANTAAVRKVRARNHRPAAPCRGHRKLTLRADSGFGSKAFINVCIAHGWTSPSQLAPTSTLWPAIDTIDDDAWVDIDYTDRGYAQVAETQLGGERLLVRRTKVTDDPKVLALFPTGATTP